jgi:hypothetical protein
MAGLPPGTGKTVKKTGWVSEYTLTLNSPPWPELKQSIFFEVTITDGGPNSGINPVTFKLPRNPKTMDVDGQNWALALTFGSVEMAMIATIKDAYLNGKRVWVEGKEMFEGFDRKTKLNQMTKVTIKERTEAYLRQIQPTISATARRTNRRPV